MNDHPRLPARTLRSTIVLLVLVLWLAFPQVAWADNCFGELGECAKKAFMANLAMIGAALAAFGAAMGAAWDDARYGPPPEPPPDAGPEPEPPPGGWQPPVEMVPPGAPPPEPPPPDPTPVPEPPGGWQPPVAMPESSWRNFLRNLGSGGGGHGGK